MITQGYDLISECDRWAVFPPTTRIDRPEIGEIMKRVSKAAAVALMTGGLVCAGATAATAEKEPEAPSTDLVADITAVCEAAAELDAGEAAEEAPVEDVEEAAEGATDTATGAAGEAAESVDTEAATEAADDAQAELNAAVKKLCDTAEGVDLDVLGDALGTVEGATGGVDTGAVDGVTEGVDTGAVDGATEGVDTGAVDGVTGGIGLN